MNIRVEFIFMKIARINILINLSSNNSKPSQFMCFLIINCITWILNKKIDIVIIKNTFVYIRKYTINLNLNNMRKMLLSLTKKIFFTNFYYNPIY